MTGGWAVRRCGSAGFSVVELIVALAVALVLLALVVPLTAHTVDVTRGRHAAGYLAARVRQARLQAIASRRATAVVFDLVSGVWRYRTCQDGNGNGVRRADINAGLDPCPTAAESLAERFTGVVIAVRSDIAGPDNEPPSADPVHLGSSNLMSCTVVGGCSPGTVFLRSPEGAQFAVRVGGMTGRTRVLFYEPGAARWVND